MFHFALDFSKDYTAVLKTFIESENLKSGSFYFMGQKTKKGVIGVVFVPTAQAFILFKILIL